MSFEWGELEFTEHAVHAMAERRILVEWVERAVTEPMLRAPDLNDFEIERFFCKIPEKGGRVLRVAVNIRVAPWRVVSVFFDRTMKGKL